ncbi:RNA-directed DNA polymerase [Candidatus Saccharibacteria bacterium]|nr:RNA-directed DNA polymerase [Candidatus Saccharibacteria bacterium]
MFNLELELYRAYLDARKGGKRKTEDEHIFEVNAFENLKNLERSIINRTYEPSRSEAHIIEKPVIREIFAAPFRDRIVHHLIFSTVYDWWDKRFIYDSYSCRKNKGVLFGIQRLDHHIRSVSQNYTKKAFVIKLDISGYFMSLPRKELLELALRGLNQQFEGQTHTTKYQTLKFLWQRTILDDPTKYAKRKGDIKNWERLPKNKSLFSQPKGVGIVIGNLTSQLLSNIYLNRLDRFITHTLGYKHYGRYVDDFYIVVKEDDLEQLKHDVSVIEEYLKSVKLTLHPKKRLLTDTKRGIPFLGAVVHHGYIIPGERLKKNIIKAYKEVVAGEKGPETVPSYLGHLRHINGYTLAKLAFELAGWDYEDDNWFDCRMGCRGKKNEN